MKIAVASLGDPRSVKTWSGIPAHIIPALEKRGHEVVAIALHKPAEPWYYTWLRRFYYRLQKKWFLSSVEKKMLQRIGQQFDDAVANSRPDIVISIHGDFLAYATFTQPSVIIHDTTFASLIDYYPEFSALTHRSILAGNDMYQRALNKASAAVFSADWASQSALHDYDVPPEKIHTIPLGANINTVPSAEEVQLWIERRAKTDACRFLFLGVNWRRKGGPDAVRFIKALGKLGIPATLVVAGCKAEVNKEEETYIEQVGFLHKNVPEENARLETLLKQCTALLLPSVAECYGCVYCEANAYGLPALGRDTGGIPEIIKDGLNGLLLGKTETPEAFAARWVGVWNDKTKYIEMAGNARSEYTNRLNYDTFANGLETILQQGVSNEQKKANKTVFYS